MIAELERCFDPAPLPNWFYAFAEGPERAIDDLLFGRFLMGSLAGEEPDDVLIDWANLVGAQTGFLQLLDQALEQWIEDNWGQFPKVSTGRLAAAWCRLADVVAFVDGLEGAASALLHRFEDREQYLGALSDGPARDALGRYLFAIARYQRDRHLAAFWWDLCDLRPGTPFYHGRYAIAGLRGLPAPDSQVGGFRSDVALGLLKVGRAMDRLVAEGLVSKATAEEFFVALGWHTVAAYPPRSKWHGTFAQAVQDTSERLINWLRRVLPEIDKPVRGAADRSHSRAHFNPGWPHRASQLEMQLAKKPEEVLPEAEKLIAEVRVFAETSGGGREFSATLAALSRGIRLRDAVRAAKWAKEATDWSPSDPRNWTHWIKALEVAGDLHTATLAAWEALELFPENAYVSTELAHLMMTSGRLAEGEQLALQTVERFPGNAHSYGVLGTILRRLEKYSQAEVVCREAIKRFGANHRWWVDLALVLVLQGRLGDAEAELRSAVKTFPNEPYLQNFLGAVLSRRGRLRDSEEVLRKAASRFGDRGARISLAGAIRRQGPHRLHEALSLIQGVLELSPSDAHALAEKARILEDMGQFEEAARAFEDVRLTDARQLDLLDDLLAAGAEWQRETGEREWTTTEEPSGSLPPTEAVERPPGGSQEDKGPETGAKPAGSGWDSRSGQAANASDIASVQLGTEPRKTAPAGPAGETERWEVAARIREARLLRKWARRNEITNESPAPAELRRRSSRLLEAVLSRAPNHPRASLEKANLLIDSGSLQEAHAFLEEKIALMPSALGLRQALGRANRELAREQKLSFDQEHYAMLTRPLLHLQERNPAFWPLAYLGRGRICLAMHDGQALRSTAARDLEHLRTYVSKTPERDGEFRAWWSEQVRDLLFWSLEPGSTLTAENLEIVERGLKESGPRVDVLEEDFTIRMSP
jgi:tetratricopeptide (TPR) repeat protein